MKGLLFTLLLIKVIQKFAKYYSRKKLSKILEAKLGSLHFILQLQRDIQKCVKSYLNTTQKKMLQIIMELLLFI